MNKERLCFFRWVDRWVGSFLLWCIGLARIRRMPPDEVRTAVLIKLDGIGDLVLTSSVVRNLQNAYPGVRIVVVHGPFNAAYAESVTDFHELLRMNMSCLWKTVRQLRNLKADVCLDLGEWSRIEALLAFFSGAKWTCGFNTPGQRRHYAHDAAMPHRRDRHEVENFQSLLLPLNISADMAPAVTPRISGGFVRDWNSQGKYVAIHMWSGSYGTAKLKEWPPENWRQIIRQLNENGFAVYLTGGPADTPRATLFVSSCVWPGARVESVAGMPFSELFNCLRAAEMVLSVDTGTMHIAAALGCRLIALHGPTSSRRWGGIGSRVVSLDSPVPGAGFMNWGADCTRAQSRLRCMEGISVESVWAAVEQQMGFSPQSGVDQ